MDSALFDAGEIRGSQLLGDSWLYQTEEGQALIGTFLHAHLTGDWGCINEDGWADNDRVVMDGNGVIESHYTIPEPILTLGNLIGHMKGTKLIHDDMIYVVTVPSQGQTYVALSSELGALMAEMGMGPGLIVMILGAEDEDEDES